MTPVFRVMGIQPHGAAARFPTGTISTISRVTATIVREPPAVAGAQGRVSPCV